MFKVLFICTGNFYRSRFAEALFNYHAHKRGLDWQAFSRGLAVDLVDGDISPFTVAGLRARKIPLSLTAPTRIALTFKDLADATRRVALKEEEHGPLMQARFPEWADRVEYWRISDIDAMDPEEGMACIERAVLALLHDIQSSP